MNYPLRSTQKSLKRFPPQRCSSNGGESRFTQAVLKMRSSIIRLVASQLHSPVSVTLWSVTLWQPSAIDQRQMDSCTWQQRNTGLPKGVAETVHHRCLMVDVNPAFTPQGRLDVDRHANSPQHCRPSLVIIDLAINGFPPHGDWTIFSKANFRFDFCTEPKRKKSQEDNENA